MDLTGDRSRNSPVTASSGGPDAKRYRRRGLCGSHRIAGLSRPHRRQWPVPTCLGPASVGGLCTGSQRFASQRCAGRWTSPRQACLGLVGPPAACALERETPFGAAHPLADTLATDSSRSRRPSCLALVEEPVAFSSAVRAAAAYAAPLCGVGLLPKLSQPRTPFSCPLPCPTRIKSFDRTSRWSQPVSSTSRS